MSFVRIWRFAAAPGRTREFEAAYGPAGDWAVLFRRGAGYLGTELLRGSDPKCPYVTIDRWRGRSDWLDFLAHHGDAYRELAKALRPLSTDQAEIGEFEVL